MKDVYIRPQSECVEVEPTLLAASFTVDNEAEDDVVAGVHKKRSHKWGDLWNE